MKPLRVAIAGCTGRTGAALVRMASQRADVELVAAVTAENDPNVDRDAGTVAGIDPVGVVVGTGIDAACDALIEFTTPAGCRLWTRWCVEHGIRLVSGTTGLSDEQRADLRSAGERVPIVWAPNMSVGINLMLRMAADLAERLGADWDVEICETHHRKKVDAPSGTAGALLEAVCAARGQRAAEAAVYGRAGDCGPRPRGQVGVHALRMGALVGEHEVHFTSDAESFSLRHRALSRDTFASGALRAACWLRGRAPGLYSMRDVLAI